MKKVKTWAQWLKEKYPAGTRLYIEHMRGKSHMNGTICTVTHVDEKGMIHAEADGKPIEIYMGTDEFREI